MIKHIVVWRHDGSSERHHRNSCLPGTHREPHLGEEEMQYTAPSDYYYAILTVWQRQRQDEHGSHQYRGQEQADGDAP